MEKDIFVLLETTNPEIFEEQAQLWPGLEVFRKHAWKCVCGEPNCFMTCCQHYADEFSDPAEFATYLEQIVCRDISSYKELEEFTVNFEQRKQLH